MRSTLVVAIAFLSACAGASTAPQSSRSAPSDSAAVKLTAEAAAAAPKDQLVCTWERPTGSNIPQRICRTKDRIGATREATQRELLAPRAARPCPGAGSCP